MNKYADQSKTKEKHLWTPASKKLRCDSDVCRGRETKHDANRRGVNGALFVCRECGTERTP
jgi:hypothetical protein